MLSFLVSPRIYCRHIEIGLGALIAEGIFLGLLSSTASAAAAVILFIMMGFASGIGNTCFDSMVMKECPKMHQGLIFGLLATLSNTILGISMFGAGMLLEWIPNRILGLIGAVGFIAAGVMLLAFNKQISNKTENSLKKPV
ncbi:hypothetical protein [Bacillus sp. SJS]|uniref:hypothetical protein n=1 Tax=Bacillus sp. SJS TaxID=1423321 RepID=UPI00068A9E12|nr:hypothetical protein [Bacillus sp. SJS]KZZ83050.1 hypothetical protein AS29_019885 [Bacillus sp. SJS]